ncbi:MAG: putative polysaccharide biosynthesis protein [Eubacteriales bacterium]
MKRSFVTEAFVLMAAASVNRVVGFIYQAKIYRLIGPEGVGLFNLVYPVYVLIIVMATAGIPLGISKLVSEEEARGNHRGSYQILWLSMSILIITGSGFTLVSYFIAPLLQKYVFFNKMVYPIFLCLLPGVFIISVSSAFRGFFQGLMNMKPPALGQVIEQIARVIIGLSLANFLLPRGIQWAAMGLAAASVAGELAGLLVMTVIFVKEKPNYLRRTGLPDKRTSLTILRKLFELCLPITLGRLALTVMLSVDAVLIPFMLRKAGYSTSAATAVYGQLTGVALTLLFVPSVITISLATSLLPAISEAVAQNRPLLVRSRTSDAVRITVLAGLPFIAAFLVLPTQITEAIYRSPESGKLLSILAVGGILAYIQQTTTGVLQGLGQPVIPLKNMVIGGIFKVAIIYYVTSIPGFGILGCGYAYDIFFLLTAGLNLVSLYSRTGFRLSFRNDILKPVTAAFICAVIYSVFYRRTYIICGSVNISVTLSLVIGFTAYLAVVVWLGSVKQADYNRLPFIRNLLKR